MLSARSGRIAAVGGTLLIISAATVMTVPTITSQPVAAAALTGASVAPAHMYAMAAAPGHATRSIPCSDAAPSTCSAVLTLTVSPVRQVLTPMGIRQTKRLKAEFDKTSVRVHQWHDELVVDVWWDGVNSGADKWNAYCKADGQWSCDPPQTGQGWFPPKAAYMNFSNRREDAGFGGHDSHSYLRTYVRPNGSTWVEMTCDCSTF